MKIVCISDTHLQHGFTVPDGDVLVHAGDATWRGTRDEVAQFCGWLWEFPHKHKVIIAGNHDWGFQKEPALFRKMIEDCGATYLEDSGVEIDGVKFWGAPWQPEFCNWAFNLSRYEGELAEKWALIPQDTQVLITHGPPHGVLDKTQDGQSVGCFDLRQRIAELPDLRLHVFGHIHPGYGRVDHGRLAYVNASTCNERYRPVNAPIVVEI